MVGEKVYWVMRGCTKIKFVLRQILKNGAFRGAHRPRLGQKLAATREEEEAGGQICAMKHGPNPEYRCHTLGLWDTPMFS